MAGEWKDGSSAQNVPSSPAGDEMIVIIAVISRLYQPAIMGLQHSKGTPLTLTSRKTVNNNFIFNEGFQRSGVAGRDKLRGTHTKCPKDLLYPPSSPNFLLSWKLFCLAKQCLFSPTDLSLAEAFLLPPS